MSDSITDIMALALNKVMEHADSALVLVTFKNEDGCTVSRYFSAGNFYASRGAAAEWLEAQHSRIDAHIKKQEND